MVSPTNRTFTIAADPTISSVEILGTFSNDSSEHWQTATPLTLQDGKYSVTISDLLPNHSYMYKYKINGAWQLDPSEPTADDEAGNTNNLLTLDSSADRPKEENPIPTTGIAILSTSNDACVPTKDKGDMVYVAREGEQPGDVKLEQVIAKEIIRRKEDPTTNDMVKVVPVVGSEDVVSEVSVEENTSSNSNGVETGSTAKEEEPVDNKQKEESVVKEGDAEKKEEEPVVAKGDPGVQEELAMEDAVVEKDLKAKEKLQEEEEAENKNKDDPAVSSEAEEKTKEPEAAKEDIEKKEEPKEPKDTKDAEKKENTGSSSDQDDSANTSTTSGAQTPPASSTKHNSKSKSKSKNKARNSTEAQSLQDASRPETISSDKHKPSRKSFNFHFNSYKESSGSQHHKRGAIKELFKKIFH